ncbi:MAG: serine protease Do [Bacteroidia bacterium]|jgi:serine protease Do
MKATAGQRPISRTVNERTAAGFGESMGLVCLLLLVLIPGAAASELPYLIDRIKPSVVGIGTAYPPRQPGRTGPAQRILGTGFAVGNGLQIITNAHVLPKDMDREHNESLVVFIGRGAQANAHPARVIEIDEAHDLALLSFKGNPLPALQLGDSDAVREGQRVAFMGFPIGMVLGLYPVTHQGLVSSIAPLAVPTSQVGELTSLHISRMRKQSTGFQLDATAYPGNSGSPVFELRHGRVIGVLNSVMVKQTRESVLTQPSGISYAIPSRYVQELLPAP